MDKINDDAYDHIYALDDVVPKRVHKIALYLYLEMSKEGKRIPPPLQDYINHGLQRILDGERTAFIVTQDDRINRFTVWNVTMTELRKVSRDQAIDKVAGLYQVEEKTIKNYLKKFDETPPKYWWYYVIDAMVSNKVE